MTAPADGTALYRIRGEGAVLLYIGISDDFGRRWKEHAKRQPWWDEMRSLSVDEWFPSRAEADAAETAAIKAERPKYNEKKVDRPAPVIRLAHGCWDADGCRPWVPGWVGWPEAHDWCPPGACLGRIEGSMEEKRRQITAANERYRVRHGPPEAPEAIEARLRDFVANVTGLSW